MKIFVYYLGAVMFAVLVGLACAAPIDDVSTPSGEEAEVIPTVDQTALKQEVESNWNFLEKENTETGYIQPIVNDDAMVLLEVITTDTATELFLENKDEFSNREWEQESLPILSDIEHVAFQGPATWHVFVVSDKSYLKFFSDTLDIDKESVGKLIFYLLSNP